MFARLFGKVDNQRSSDQDNIVDTTNTSKLRTITEDELLIHGYIKHQKYLSIPIPIDIINLLLLFYHIEWEMLKFMANTKGFKLSEDRLCAIKQDKWIIQSIVADIEPVKSGIHCWRVYSFTNHVPFAWTVSETNLDRNFTEIGIINLGIYKAIRPQNKYSLNKFDCDVFGKGAVDILLNVDKGILRMCVVGFVEEPYGITMKGLPIPGVNYHKHSTLRRLEDEESVCHQGYVPRLFLCGCEQKAKIAQIPIQYYGKPIRNLFGEFEDEKCVQYSIDELNSEDLELCELEFMLY